MASSSNSTIHQFKIELRYLTPIVWREIQVPSAFDMYDLHCALNDAMGWKDRHYHVFKRVPTFIGQPLENTSDPKKRPRDGRSVKMTDCFVKAGDNFEYWYDFGAPWEHEVTLQNILSADRTKSYPICIDGKRACPPDDYYDVDTYKRILRAIQNKRQPEYTEQMYYLERHLKISNFDPDRFDPTDVQFRPRESKVYSYSNSTEEMLYDFIAKL